MASLNKVFVSMQVAGAGGDGQLVLLYFLNSAVVSARVVDGEPQREKLRWGSEPRAAAVCGTSIPQRCWLPSRNPQLVLGIFFFFFLAFLGHTHSKWKFPG